MVYDYLAKKGPAIAGPFLNQFGLRNWARLFCELGDSMREARDLAARTVLVNDVSLTCPHQLRLGALHRLDRGIAIAFGNRFLNDPDRAAHQSPSRLVDGGASGNLARRFLGGGRIGHGLDVSFGSVSPREPAGCAGHVIARVSLNVFPVVPENATLEAN